MKHILFSFTICALLASSLEASAQAPAWQTALAAQSPYSTYSTPVVIRATATDAAGNVYIAGDGDGAYTLGGLRSFGPFPGSHMFVAKWSPVTGDFSWIKNGRGSYPGASTGGYPSCGATAIAVSGSNVYVTGRFWADMMYFDGSTTPLHNRTNGAYTSNSDIFVAKFTDSGSTASFVWAQGVGSMFHDTPTALVADGAAVYLAANSTYGPTMYFGNTAYNGAGTYVAKLLDAGSTSSFEWAQPVSGTVSGLAVAGNDVVIAGQFSTATVSYGATTLTSAGGSDAFVAKLTDSGTARDFAWAYGAGGAGNDQISAIAANGASFYVTGSFTSAAARFGNTTLPASGGTDVFVAKVTDSGFVWAQQAGGTGDEAATGMAADGPNIYVCGTLTGAAASFGVTLLTNAGGTDVFLARLTDGGSSAGFNWAKRGGGAGNDAASAVAVRAGSVYVGGTVVALAAFDNQTITASRSQGTGLLASLIDTAALATTTATWAAELRVAPNPAKTTAIVHIPAVAGATQSTLTLLDGQGRTVRTQVVPLPAAGLTTELPLTGLAPGLYHLQMQAGGQQTSRALMVE